MSQVERLMVTVPEAAKLLSISRSQAYELVSQGVIPSKRLGRKCVRVPVSALYQFAKGEEGHGS